MEDLLFGDGALLYHPRVRRGIDYEPQPNGKAASEVGAFTPCGAVSTRGGVRFHPQVIGDTDGRNNV